MLTRVKIRLWGIRILVQGRGHLRRLFREVHQAVEINEQLIFHKSR
jgi:hypothetical protein